MCCGVVSSSSWRRAGTLTASVAFRGSPHLPAQRLVRNLLAGGPVSECLLAADRLLDVVSLQTRGKAPSADGEVLQFIQILYYFGLEDEKRHSETMTMSTWVCVGVSTLQHFMLGRVATLSAPPSPPSC